MKDGEFYRIIKWIYPILALVVFLNGASVIHLFDNYTVQSFPFTEHLKYLWSLGGGTEIFPYAPVR